MQMHVVLALLMWSNHVHAIQPRFMWSNPGSCDPTQVHVIQPRFMWSDPGSDLGQMLGQVRCMWSGLGYVVWTFLLWPRPGLW